MSFCVRFRRARHTGRDARGPFARDPDPTATPRFLGKTWRRQVALAEVAEQTWNCATRAGAGMIARSPRVRAFAIRYRLVADVVTVKYALRWWRDEGPRSP
jgi:hypothetical protein